MPSPATPPAGLFLLFKATKEIHEKLEGEDGGKTARLAPTFAAVIVQILILDIVASFSLDSVITAVEQYDANEGAGNSGITSIATRRSMRPSR